VRKETGRWKDRWKVRDHLADGRCSRAVLDFLSSTDVGRRVPAEAEDDAVSTVSELEEREWLEEQGAGAEEPGAGGNRRCSCPHPTSWRPQKQRRHGSGVLSFVLSFVIHARSSLLFFSFVISLVRTTHSRDRPGRRAKGVLATSRHCADSGQETDCTYPLHDLDRLHASNE